MSERRCDKCGSTIIDLCLSCGAPQCCPSCCNVASLESDLARVKEELEKVREYGINAEANALEKHDALKVSCAELVKALEGITNVSQFGREGGPIVTSEHYEACWLDCVDIAKDALAKHRERVEEK